MLRLGYRPALDGLRGLAIAAVVLYHTFGWPSGGYLGVDLFFVLSGFLITTLLLEEREAYGCISLTAFYQRRALRLLPALVAMVGLLMLGVYVAYLHGRISRETMVADLAKYLGAMLYVGNVVRASGVELLAVNHLWSLAQEEQFYLLWPACLIALITRETRRLDVGCVLVAGLIVVYRVILVFSGASFDRVFYAPDTRFDALLIGCAIALARARSPRAFLFRHATALGTVGLAAWCFLVVSSTGADNPALSITVGLTAAEIAAALIVVGAVDGDRRAVAGLEARPLVLLGVISYGLYVWHAPLLAGTGHSIFGLTIALSAAVLSYRYVERPFLRMKRHARSREQTSRLTTVAAERD
jgi:peptidoglycan/LPS O-acetylase OafA/YrhL